MSPFYMPLSAPALSGSNGGILPSLAVDSTGSLLVVTSNQANPYMPTLDYTRCSANGSNAITIPVFGGAINAYYPAIGYDPLSDRVVVAFASGLTGAQRLVLVVSPPTGSGALTYPIQHPGYLSVFGLPSVAVDSSRSRVIIVANVGAAPKPGLFRCNFTGNCTFHDLSIMGQNLISGYYFGLTALLDQANTAVLAVGVVFPGRAGFFRANLVDGSGASFVDISTGLQGLSHPAAVLDASAGKVVVALSSSVNKVLLIRSSLDGTDAVNITITVGQPGPGTGIEPAIAIVGSYLYIATRNISSLSRLGIIRCSLDGSNPVRISAGASLPVESGNSPAVIGAGAGVVSIVSTDHSNRYRPRVTSLGSDGSTNSTLLFLTESYTGVAPILLVEPLSARLLVAGLALATEEKALMLYSTNMTGGAHASVPIGADYVSLDAKLMTFSGLPAVISVGAYRLSGGTTCLLTVSRLDGSVLLTFEVVPYNSLDPPLGCDYPSLVVDETRGYVHLVIGPFTSNSGLDGEVGMFSMAIAGLESASVICEFEILIDGGDFSIAFLSAVLDDANAMILVTAETVSAGNVILLMWPVEEAQLSVIIPLTSASQSGMRPSAVVAVDRIFVAVININHVSVVSVQRNGVDIVVHALNSLPAASPHIAFDAVNDRILVAATGVADGNAPIFYRCVRTTMVCDSINLAVGIPGQGPGAGLAPRVGVTPAGLAVVAVENGYLGHTAGVFFVGAFCPDLSVGQFAFGNATTARVGETVGFFCLFGLSLTGTATRTCLANLTWTGAADAKCLCLPSLVGTLPLGTVNCTAGTNINSVCNFTCGTNMSLAGAPSRVCQLGGWSGAGGQSCSLIIPSECSVDVPASSTAGIALPMIGYARIFGGAPSSAPAIFEIVGLEVLDLTLGFVPYTAESYEQVTVGVGLYSLLLNITRAGFYLFDVTVNNQQVGSLVSTSSREVTIHPGPVAPWRCTLAGPMPSRAGDATEATVAVRDRYGNDMGHGGDSIVAELGYLGRGVQSLAIEDKSSGFYLVRVVATAGGRAELRITANGLPIAGSPMTLLFHYDCGPGLYIADEATGLCTLCANGTYANETAAFACHRCDLEGHLQSQQGALFQRDCYCVAGYFTPRTIALNPTVNISCLACPQGAQCAGGRTLPVAEPGWWVDPTTYQSTACVPAAVCTGGNGCRRGHTGATCATCEPGWYRKSGLFCTPCPPGKQIVYPLFAALALLACIGFLKLARKSSHYFAPLAVGLSFLQIVSLLPSLSPRWPGWVSAFCRAFSLANLDVSQLFEPQCVVSSSSPFVPVWAFKMALPLLIVGIFAVFALLGLIYARLQPLAVKCCAQLPPLGPAPLQRYLWTCINAGASCLALVYMSVCSVALSVLPCTRQPDGRQTMNAEPSILCTSGTWRRLLTFTVLQLILFGAALPLVILVVLVRARHALWQQKYLIALGMLYRRYRPSMFFFEALNLSRKLAFVFGTVFFSSSSSGPMAWALGVTLIALVYTVALQPFENRNVTRLEITAQSCAAAVLTLGLIFFGVSHRLSSRAANGLASFVVIFIGLTIAVIAGGVIAALRRQRELVRRGVQGGFGTDRLIVTPLFFEQDVYIRGMVRGRTGTAATWHITLETATGAPLETLLTQTEIGKDAPVDEVAQALMGEGADSSKGARYARLTQTSAGGQHLSHCMYVLPCRGVYSAQIALGGELVMAFSLSADHGCITGQSMVWPDAAFGDGLLLAPFERRLEAGRKYRFLLRPSGDIAETFVGDAPMFIEDGGFRSCEVIVKPGPLHVTGYARASRSASVQGSAENMSAEVAERIANVGAAARESLGLLEYECVVVENEFVDDDDDDGTGGAGLVLVE